MFANDRHLTYITDTDVNSTESCVNEDLLAIDRWLYIAFGATK